MSQTTRTTSTRQNSDQRQETSRRRKPSGRKTETPKTIRDLFTSSELVLVKKDLHLIWHRNGVRLLLMLMPLVLVVVVPIVYSAAISLLPAAAGAKAPEAILALLPPEAKDHEYHQFWLDAFTTLLCPMLFLCVPIVCGVISASCAFISEKEGNTLETLFLTSMPPRTVFNAKITVCVLLSVGISLVSFVFFAISMSVADILISAPYFFSFDWLVTVILLMPALALFSVVFVSLLMKRVHGVGEAMQTMGYLILPFILLYLAQFAGVLRINTSLLFFMALILAAAGIVLYNVSARKFQVEALLDRT